jgi:hypothetical protein
MALDQDAERILTSRIAAGPEVIQELTVGQ